MTANLSRGRQSVKHLARRRRETRRRARTFCQRVENHAQAPAWPLSMIVARHYILCRIAAQSGCLIDDLTDEGVALVPLTGDAPRA
jgi:hypothetical protein